jgi:hypothetical protein
MQLCTLRFSASSKSRYHWALLVSLADGAWELGSLPGARVRAAAGAAVAVWTHDEDRRRYLRGKA